MRRDDQAGLFPRHFVPGYYLEALQAYLITVNKKPRSGEILVEKKGHKEN